MVCGLELAVYLKFAWALFACALLAFTHVFFQLHISTDIILDGIPFLEMLL
jgi:hypothetical protein